MSKPSSPKPPKTPDTQRSVLSIAVTPESLEAVLLRQNGEHVELVQRFIRSRARRAELATADSLALALPDLKGSEGSDYTLEVGGGGDGSAGGGSVPSFLPGEFAGLGKGAGKGAGAGKKGAEKGLPTAQARPFAPQLQEILQECRGLGYNDPALVFTEGPPDLAYVELQTALGEDKADDETARSAAKNGKAAAAPAGATVGTAERKRLLALLAERTGAPADDDRVAFLPLTASATHRRVLALVAEPTEPVAATLAILREKQAVGLPTTRLLEAELAAYASLFRNTSSATPGERSALVRVGGEDTLVLFFDGTALLHGERLRSVTSYDLPDTVCSRVLLQQDEKKVGDLHNVLVVGGGRLEPLLDRFRRFFPDAAVEPLERVLRESGVRLPENDDEPLRSGVLTATVGGLAYLRGWEDVTSGNLLPQSLRRRQRRRTGVAWHTAVAALLLLLALAVAGVRYTTAQAALEDERTELRLNPPVLPSDNPDLLQARVDSLNHAYATYTRALHVLDSLLVGSDKWIQSMSRVTTASANTGRVWIDSWAPQGNQLWLSGRALDRLTIVELARRLDAPIELLNYEDIGERRVYSFEMVTDIPAEMPEVANFLRAVAESNLRDDSTRADPGPMEVNPSEAARASD